MLNYHRPMLQRAVPGQSLVLIAIMLPFLVILVMGAMRIGWKIMQRGQVEDALRQSTRSAVQTFDYQAFAKNSQDFRATACQGSITSGCAGNAVAELASQLFAINLQSTDGLTMTPDDVAKQVTWYILPEGGDCSTILADRNNLQRTFTTPSICAQLDAPMEGLIGWGTWTPRIDAADTLDRIQ